jgi:formylglycine-generating enzyme
VRRWSSTAALALAFCGCGGEASLPPQGQILLFIDTDAPLSAAPGRALDPSQPPSLFDRLRVEVRRVDAAEGAPPLARRDFPLHRGAFDAGPVSVGIVPEAPQGGLLARARLYRSVNVRAGEIAVTSTVDVTQLLPEVGRDGVVKAELLLHVDDTGQPQVLDGVAEEPVIKQQSLVGTWPPAAVAPCPEPPAEEEACVPGGAFWMGDPDLRDDTEVADADREHLVVVSPFFIDTHEVTVGELRAHATELRRAGVPLPPEWSGSNAGISDDDYSTYTPGPSSNDPADVQATLPVDAVAWQTAQAYCHALGKELPSEVMYEFLASGRGLENKFVWGNDEPSSDEAGCQDVVAGRAGFGPYVTFDGACRPSDSIGGPLAAGGGKRDQIELDAVLVSDLAGNLSEWMLDWFTGEDDSVWATPGVLRDPVELDAELSKDRHTVRGGSWRSRYVQLRAAARVGRDPRAENRSVGFRCARRPWAN